MLNEATQRGFAIDDLSTEQVSDRSPAPGVRESNGKPAMVAVTMHVHGRRPVSELASALSDLDLVDAVVATNRQDADELGRAPRPGGRFTLTWTRVSAARSWPGWTS